MRVNKEAISVQYITVSWSSFGFGIYSSRKRRRRPPRHSWGGSGGDPGRHHQARSGRPSSSLRLPELESGCPEDGKEGSRQDSWSQLCWLMIQIHCAHKRVANFWQSAAKRSQKLAHWAVPRLARSWLGGRGAPPHTPCGTGHLNLLGFSIGDWFILLLVSRCSWLL
jgi:hypothetical protein